jgi:lipoate-protein ligase A
MKWSVHHRTDSVGAFHNESLTEGRSVYVVDAPGTALVLGSRQGLDVLNLEACEQRGIDVVVRRSGGGIVFLVHGQYLWIDLVISRDDPLWTDDVRASMRWLGEAWCSALQCVGVGPCAVHEGALVGGALGDLVCFAGVGPGEVVDVARAKLVGIAQRRTRDFARFQCTVLRRWDPEELVSVLDKQHLAEHLAEHLDVNELRRRVRTVDVEPDALVSAFIHALP